MEKEVQQNPEFPEHILTISLWIVKYARGDISLEEYRSQLDIWYEKNRDAWKENDLTTLFLACCLST